MVICYLGVGSNMGKRKINIQSAVRKIRALKNTEVLKVSPFIETEPQGGPAGQSRYLNGALKIKTGLTPLKLLKALQSIENELGREKTVRNGPRTIDIDILFYGDKIIHSRDLIIPHPRMFEREFVLEPLTDLME